MPQYVEVKGQTIEFPDGMSAPDIEAAIKKNMMSIPPEKPAAVQAGGMLNQIPRQFGLAARYGLEGLADTAQIVTEPIRNVQNLVTGGNARPLREVATGAADFIGLPKPATANERVIGDASRLVAGTGGVLGGARALAGGAQAGTRAVLNAFAANPTAQLTAAAGGGLAGGASREAGGTAPEQVVSSVLGTVLGGMAPGAATKTTTALKNLIPKQTQGPQLEVRIAAILADGGVDWNAIPNDARRRMVEEVRRATTTGDNLDPAAVRRLADFVSTNTTPTRGGITLDPVQITREKNLSKIGANTADTGLQGLAGIENRNNAQLIQNLNALGAGNGSTAAAGGAVTGAVQRQRDTLRSAEQAAWDAAKGSPGYRQPISSKVISDINGALGDEGLMPFMNPTISRYMEAFQTGQPFTPQDYRNLQSMLSREIAKGGNEGAAARLAASVLRDSDIQPITNPRGIDFGNLPSTPQMAAAMRAADAAPADAIEAVNRARSATRQAYAYEDSSPLVRSVLSDARSSDPVKIADSFIIKGTASDARMVLNEIGPTGRQEVKNALLSHLKEKALSGAADEVGKFSQSAFNKALNGIGEDKLRMFFTPQEIQQLRANGRVASYMQVQPAGSAVNNSNSGALMVGSMMDALPSVVRNMPLARPLILDPIRDIGVTIAQRQAQNTAPALLTPIPSKPVPALLAPAVSFGGLLSAPPNQP